MVSEFRHVEIVHRRRLKQKWYAKFIADNGLVLAVTEHYSNLDDLKAMLQNYYPDWIVEVTS
jgi:hypothetical protein